MTSHAGSLLDGGIDDYYLQNKKDCMARHGASIWGNRRPDLVPQAAKILGLESSENIVDLAMQIKEDIAILHQASLVNICFCFPSSWVPALRLGQSLTEIHRPVADGEALQRHSLRIAEIMAQQGNFRRWVWTISTTDQLSNHPDQPRPPVTASTGIDDLWLRTERQTTFPLGDGESSGFLVLVETHPLQIIWQDSDQKTAMINSLNSMTDAVLDYKNLRDIKNLLNSL